VAKIFNSTKLAKLLHQRVLSDEFRMVAIGNSPIKIPISQTFSCTLEDTKTVNFTEEFFIWFE